MLVLAVMLMDILQHASVSVNVFVVGSGLRRYTCV